MKKIICKNGEEVLVDAKDYKYLKAFKWSVQNEYGYKYAVTVGKIKMHRIIMEVTHNSKLFVDHINHNGLDNRRKNLRVCTLAENLRNQKVRINSTTKAKGIHKLKASGKYQVFCCVNSKREYLGVYNTIEEAINVYNEAAIRMHGDFAYLNMKP